MHSGGLLTDVAAVSDQRFGRTGIHFEIVLSGFEPESTLLPARYFPLPLPSPTDSNNRLLLRFRESFTLGPSGVLCPLFRQVFEVPYRPYGLLTNHIAGLRQAFYRLLPPG